jgi:DNA-binding CsgD family transcriptional regulator
VTSAEIVMAGRPELATYAERFGPRALTIVPIRARGQVIGNLTAIRRREAEPFDADEERFAQTIADLVGLAVAGGGPPSQQLSVPGGSGLPQDLSDREREVLALLALGHTNREIAEQLVLSVRTVEWHRARIQWKLGISGRAALAKAARAGGLID